MLYWFPLLVVVLAVLLGFVLLYAYWYSDEWDADYSAFVVEDPYEMLRRKLLEMSEACGKSELDRMLERELELEKQ